ncbi:hypothetical protein SLEP1_g47595 [Rubroshorea leprosula]|uniref:Uncharacterized protein n=1 Tax=Rubroshorea leprosula TaxID=152421 RepID=A0AAV5LR07_9ROSI|nr:hypothetical protein SLEP1_g47595 [Rubroshorea leprosula]
MNRQRLFTSDQDLYTDARTKEIVQSLSADETQYLEKFVHSMIKMWTTERVDWETRRNSCKLLGDEFR